MTSPLVNPDGYSTFSRFDSSSWWPSTSTVTAVRFGATPRSGRLLGLGLARRRRRMALARRLGRLDAGLQRRHQVDDLRLLGGHLGHLELLAGGLLLDQVEDLLAVVVVVLVGGELIRQRVD